MTRKAGALVLIVALFSMYSIVGTAEEYPPDYSDSGYWLNMIEEWRKAVEEHQPGEADAAAVRIGRWSPFELEFSIALFKRLIQRPLYKLAVPPQGCRSLAEYLGLKKEKDKNYWLKRGALLHADIALLGLEKGSAGMYGSELSFMKESLKKNKREQAKTCWRVALLKPAILDLKDQGYLQTAWIQDGMPDYGNVGRHMEFGRLLLDSVSPSPSQDEMAKEWYIATAAYGLSRGRPDYIDSHLKAAVNLFRFDGLLFYYAGSLHETYATPRYQNAPRLPKIKYLHGSKQEELELARKFFQRALLINPDFFEARLRLGRVLGLLGHHSRAVSELQKASAPAMDPELKYYAALFLGNELAALGRTSEARTQFQKAAALYPDAQSPLFALSWLAHSRGDIQNASDSVEQAFSVAIRGLAGNDPRRKYDLVSEDKAAALLLKMRKSFGELSR